ncbi:uncharacterized protein LOC120351460 [Nilaparvata lugens]|uniref:uncharacterized protein LOC120351460 n=1 Tax=Nilaparvata lugens TaxID=108931 RepID=UPI00193CDCF0|nr:uncharacterized protein LOC120351460 [Nilaparvata lugens]
MSCDSFHHLVEKSLHRMKKVYDFGDFKDAVQSSKSKALAIEMAPNDFFKWKDYSAKRLPNQGKIMESNTRIKRGRRQDSQNLDECTENENIPEQGSRPYLKDVVHVQARRGLLHLLYNRL